MNGILTSTNLAKYIIIKNFKCIIETESYLSLNISSKCIRTFSKFRCSAHNLLVETGRLTGIPYQQRICSFCPLHEIEDECRFVFICPLYSDVSDLYFPEKYKRSTPSQELFYEMMKSKNEYVMYHVMKNIFFAVIKREEHRIECYNPVLFGYQMVSGIEITI